jgi:type I site-specific restriction endonuclease
MSLRSPVRPTKKSLKEEILEEITETLMDKIILDMVNQNVQDTLKKFQDTKNKDRDKTQKKIKELREDFNKHQSETKATILKRHI